MLTTDQINDLHHLYWVERWPIRKIEQHLHMSWHTIKKYLEAPAQTPAARSRVSKLDPFKPTIAEPRVRLAERAQVVFSETSTRNGPVSRFTPTVDTHYEDTHCRVAISAIVLAFKQVVEPGELQPVDRIDSFESEIYVTDLRLPGEVYIRPND